MNLILVAATTKGFIFHITDSLMRNLGGYAGPGLTVIANKRSGGVVKTVL